MNGNYAAEKDLHKKKRRPAGRSHVGLVIPGAMPWIDRAFAGLNVISQPVEITAWVSIGEYPPLKAARFVVSEKVPAPDTNPMDVVVLATLI